MILRIFETPLIDVILIVLAIRFIFPGLFGIKRKRTNGNNKRQEKIFVRKESPSSSKYSEKEGEYIDYEEIK